MVFIQFACLAYLFYSGPIFASTMGLQAIELSGFIIGLWAIWAMGLYNFNISPQIKEGARFKTSGPYKFIRHPMYLAIILTVTPLLVDNFSILRLGIFLVLMIDLITKMIQEERLLKQKFTGYEEYMKRTWRIIPFIF